MSSVVFISIIFPKSSKLKDYSQVFPCIPHPHPSLTLPLFTPSHTAFVHPFSHCFSSHPLSLPLLRAASLSSLFLQASRKLLLLRFSPARFSAAISQPSLSCASLPHVFLLPSHNHLSPTLLFRTFFSCHFRPPLLATTIGYHFWLPFSATISALANGSPIGNAFLFLFRPTLTRVFTMAFECAYRAPSSRVSARQLVCASS